ncbi:trace amine-associated receptor 1-like [Brachyhypopomus gauderio]|uniref:trace amine-associated receptor 1-like n=1 Tax=Brachyhypopomus gauderio TaxID=698409 RepID=UPI0040429315
MDYKWTLNQSVMQENLPLCYGSVNNSCVKTVYAMETRTFLYILLSLITLFTLFGNLLVIITIIHFKQMHTPANYLILSLAVTDLLIGVLVMPPSVIRTVETCWYLGKLFCKLHSSLDVTLSDASILNLFLISIDRYYAVTHPLLYPIKITSKITLIMIFVGWSLAAFVGFGITYLELGIMGEEDIYYSTFACEGGCIVYFSKTAIVVFTMINFYIPAVVLVSMYLKIFHIAQRQAHMIHNGQVKTRHQHTKMRKTEIKATKTLAIVIGVFILFWAPFFFCSLFDPFLGPVIPRGLFDVLSWIGYFNSTCNPIVYAFFYRWFRKSFNIILQGKIFKPNSSRLKLF